MTESTRLTDSTPNHRAESSAVAPETVQATNPTRTPRPASPAKSTRRLSPWVVALMGVIAAGAFAISADSWIRLAELAGFTASAAVGVAAWSVTIRLAWVLPVVVDAYTALTTWLYFGARVGSDLRAYAGWSAFVAAALSVIAQGALHGLTASHVDVQKVWPLVVAVGGVPPVLLGSVIHLLATYLAEHRQPTAGDVTGKPSQPARVATAVRTKPAPTQPIEPRRADATQPGATRAARVASPEPVRQTQRLAAVPDADAADAKQASDDEVADAIRVHVLDSRRAGVEPGQREMVRLVFDATGAKVGQKRCVRIASTITDSPESTDDDKEGATGARPFASATA